MRLLVVEDPRKMAALIERGLEEEGYAVDVAHDGEQALWLARENAYDAIMLDADAPGTGIVQETALTGEAEVARLVKVIG